MAQDAAYDAIIIGSGIGGLTTAGLFAATSGMSALAAAWMILGFAQGTVPLPAAGALRLLQRLTGRTATGTTKAYLDAHFRSPALKAVLASQWGDYGLPPSRSAFAVHALIVSHYLEGAWFPRGGSARIARTFEQGIEEAGGAVRVAQEVSEILIEDGAAVGVRVLDRRGPVARKRIHRTPVIICAIGALATYSRLLPTCGAKRVASGMTVGGGPVRPIACGGSGVARLFDRGP